MFFKTIARSKSFAGYVFILPSLLILITFSFMPLLFSFAASFYQFNLMLDGFAFVRLDHYRAALADERFWNSLKNTLYYTVGLVPVQVALSIATAVALHKRSKMNVLFRSVYFLPVVCSMTIIAMIMYMLLDFNVGIIPANMRKLGLPVLDLFNHPVWAMPTIIGISVFKSFGFTMVILIAALQGVPNSLYEAAEVDGAGKRRQFFSITLPSIVPTLAFVVITTLIGSFNVFDQVYVTTKGGPLYKTETMIQLIYERAFVTNELGIANASAVLLFVLILFATLLSLRVSRGGEQNF